MDNIYELHNCFPIKCNLIPIDNVDEGVIIKFNTFYLKIYKNYKFDSYEVTGYLYNISKPKFKCYIKYHKFKEFVYYFEDNYLKDIDKKIKCLMMNNMVMES